MIYCGKIVGGGRRQWLRHIPLRTIQTSRTTLRQKRRTQFKNVYILPSPALTTLLYLDAPMGCQEARDMDGRARSPVFACPPVRALKSVLFPALHSHESNIDRYLEFQRKRDTPIFLSFGSKFGRATGLRNKVRIPIPSLPPQAIK